MTLPSGNGNQTGHVQGVFWCWWWWWTSTKETRRRWMDGWRLIIFPVHHCPAWVNFSDDEQEEQKEAQEDVLKWFDFLTLCCFVASNKWHFSFSLLLWSSRLLRVPSFSIIALQSSIISISFFACPFSNDPATNLTRVWLVAANCFNNGEMTAVTHPVPELMILWAIVIDHKRSLIDKCRKLQVPVWLSACHKSSLAPEIESCDRLTGQDLGQDHEMTIKEEGLRIVIITWRYLSIDPHE